MYLFFFYLTFLFLFLGLTLRDWRNELSFVLNTINHTRNNLSRSVVLSNYFTGPRSASIPQNVPEFYRFNINDLVRVDLMKTQRIMPFKYSLERGKIPI